MINTIVNLEIAKLLHEKGFDEPTWLCVADNDERPLPFDAGSREHINSLHPFYSAPSIAQVLEWLYQNHSIWIQVSFSHNDTKPFSWSINKTLRNLSVDCEDQNCWLSGIDCENIDGFDTPDEAFKAAISYVLENLIS